MTDKSKMWRRGITAALIAVYSLVGVQAVSAQSTTVTLQIGLIDVCPNILGTQTIVPPGMIIDGFGDCVTPPPPVVDVCNNIAGNQTTIPSGYYRDAYGDCFVQPTPPIDVCPNIFGTQAIVPSSLIVDELGNCIAPPIDECPNIDGPQSAIPEGMVKVNSICFTPEPEDTTTTTPENITPTPPSSTPGATPDYKNVPAVIDPIIDPIVKAIPEPVKAFVKTVPVEIARTVPYYIYAVLAISAGIMFLQAIREMLATRSLLLLLKREKNIAEQKDNFIALASHYLRTPLTLMLNGLDTIVALKELTDTKVQPIKSVLSTMDSDIKVILTDIEGDQALKEIQTPGVETHTHDHPLRSVYVWIPLVSSLLLTWLANFLLGVVADVDLGVANLLFQVIVLVAVSIAFYTAYRNHTIRRRERLRQQTLVTHERSIDAARNAFISRSTGVLQRGLTDLYNQRHVLDAAPSARFFDEGYLRFNGILEKFLLLGKIQADAIADTETINLRETVETIAGEYSDIMTQKQITFSNNINGVITIKQNRALFEFVLRSVIDNAIKFNSESGTIAIDADRDAKQLVVHVNDNGVGIPKDKLAQLFKPFSRADSALQFNYEGLGFSLFLDKIITDYMGGDILATSTKGSGTAITVKTALA
jgi:signal transduction histidine kinase